MDRAKWIAQNVKIISFEPVMAEYEWSPFSGESTYKKTDFDFNMLDGNQYFVEVNGKKKEISERIFKNLAGIEDTVSLDELMKDLIF